jgi:hypothetical protein
MMLLCPLNVLREEDSGGCVMCVRLVPQVSCFWPFKCFPMLGFIPPLTQKQICIVGLACFLIV